MIIDSRTLEDCKVTIVYHKKSKKLIPFTLDNLTGEIIILSVKAEYNPDDLIVSRVDPLRLDLLNGYLLSEGETNAEI